jgi:hypothetical protein
MSNLVPRSIRRNTWTPGDLAGDRSRTWSRRDLANELAMMEDDASLVPFWAEEIPAEFSRLCDDENWCTCRACKDTWARMSEERECWQMHGEFLWGFAWYMQDLDADRACDARELAAAQKADFLAGK